MPSQSKSKGLWIITQGNRLHLILLCLKNLNEIVATGVILLSGRNQERHTVLLGSRYSASVNSPQESVQDLDFDFIPLPSRIPDITRIDELLYQIYQTPRVQSPQKAGNRPIQRYHLKQNRSTQNLSTLKQLRCYKQKKKKVINSKTSNANRSI